MKRIGISLGLAALFAGLVYLFFPRPAARVSPKNRAGHPSAADRGISNALPRPRETQTSGQTPAGKKPHSPTGNPELDEVYRTNPAWAKRWDDYAKAFIRAQGMHQQPPSPPEHPDVDKKRFEISQPPPGF